MTIDELKKRFDTEKEGVKKEATFDKMMKFYYTTYNYLKEVCKQLTDSNTPDKSKSEMYETSFKLINELNSIMIDLSDCFAPYLSYSFLFNGIVDTEWVLDRIMEYERDASLLQKKGGFDNLYSKMIVDYILRTYEQAKDGFGSKIREKEVAEKYGFVSFDYDLYFGEEAFDLSLSYLMKGLEALEKQQHFLLEEESYNESIKSYCLKIVDHYEKYNKPVPLPILNKVLELDEALYRGYQKLLRMDYLKKVDENLSASKYEKAKKYMDLIIEIDEERNKNINVTGCKLTLRNHYQKYLSFLKKDDETYTIIDNKFKKLISTLTHEDEFVKDGDNEYPRPEE